MICFLCFGCGSLKNSTPNTIVYGTSMSNAFEGYYSKAQFDSICYADTILPDLGMWHQLPLIDYETGENVSQYLYIKSLGKNECIYRVHIITNDLYKITKRITR